MLKIGQGRENAKTYLRENPAFCKMLEDQVREHHFAQPVEGEVSKDDPTEEAKLLDPED